MRKRQPRKSKTLYQSSIINGALFFEDVRQCALTDEIAEQILDDPELKAIRVVSLMWDWQEQVRYTADITRVEDINVEMTLRKEIRGNLAHWYAYRRVMGILYKRYVGHSDQVNEERLLKIARSLPSI